MQEGVLAQTIAFQFQNGAIDEDNLIRRLPSESASNTDKSPLVGVTATRTILDLFNMKQDQQSISELFKMLWANVRHRESSKPTDQAVCAAVLCNIDLRPILAAADEDRMLVFWKTSRIIPIGVFWAAGPRYDIDTMRWAPKSMLDPRCWIRDVGPSRSQAGLLRR